MWAMMLKFLIFFMSWWGISGNGKKLLKVVKFEGETF